MNDKKSHAPQLFFKEMLENLSMPGIIVSPDRKIKYCNKDAESIFGYSPKELLGKRTELLYGDRRKQPKAKREIYNLLDSYGFHSGKADGKTKNGQEMKLKILTFLIKPEGAVVVMEKSVHAGKHEVDKDKFLRDLLDNIPDMIYFKDRQNRFVLVNKAHAEALNKIPEEIIGKTDLDFFPKKIAEKYFKDDIELIKKGKPIIGEIERARRSDGGITYVSTTKIPHYDEKGKIIGIIGITRNITDKMVAEEELQNYKERLEELVKKRTKELEEANDRILRMYDIKTEFTSLVSHELRTPLTVIRESVAVVEEGILGEVSKKQKRQLAIALDNIKRLTRLINDLLDLGKLESGKMKFDMTRANVNELLGEIGTSYRSTAGKKGIELELNLNPLVPNMLFDRDRIAQVVHNLVNNAIKFTDQGSVKISSASDSKYIKIAVKDTGRGIKKSDLGRVFNKFEQLARTGKTEGGTGLGLAICKEIIEQFHGKIFVTSQFGKGSEFSFYLPRDARR